LNYPACLRKQTIHVFRRAFALFYVYISFIDPARGEEIEIDVDAFLAAWDERGRLGLVIEP